MNEITIASRGYDPGNKGNWDRDIDLTWIDGMAGGGWLRIGVKEVEGDWPTRWNISRAAAEKLLVALDIMLTNSEPEDEPEGHYEGSFGFTKTPFDVV